MTEGVVDSHLSCDVVSFERFEYSIIQKKIIWSSDKLMLHFKTYDNKTFFSYFHIKYSLCSKSFMTISPEYHYKYALSKFAAIWSSGSRKEYQIAKDDINRWRERWLMPSDNTVFYGPCAMTVRLPIVEM